MFDLVSICTNCPIAGVSLLQKNKESIICARGTTKKSIPRQYSLTAHIVRTKEPLLIENVSKSMLFSETYHMEDNRLFKTFIGFPLQISLSLVVGTMFCIFYEEKKLTKEDLKKLSTISHQVMTLFQLDLKENELQRLRNLRSELPSLLVDELENPINALKSSLNPINEVNQNIQDSLSSSATLKKIVNDLVDHSTLYSGEYGINIHGVRFNNLVKRAITNPLSHQAKELKLETNFDPKIDEIQCDEEKIEKAIIALSEYTYNLADSDAKITVSTRNLDIACKLKIKSNKARLDQLTVEGIFDPYSFSTKFVNRGSNLDITLAKQIIDLHNGMIKFDTTDDNGFVFLLILPIHQYRGNLLPAGEHTLKRRMI